MNGVLRGGQYSRDANLARCSGLRNGWGKWNQGGGVGFRACEWWNERWDVYKL